jgi:hypothetical protein
MAVRAMMLPRIIPLARNWRNSDICSSIVPHYINIFIKVREYGEGLAGAVMIERRELFGLFFWAALSLVITAYIISSYNSGYISELYKEDMNTYALFSLGAILALGVCLGMLSEKITEAFGLEIEEIEHFEG